MGKNQYYDAVFKNVKVSHIVLQNNYYNVILKVKDTHVLTKATCPILNHTSASVCSSANDNARSKQVKVISYCWA